MTFPKQHRIKLLSTNPNLRHKGEIKRRSDVVGTFPNNDAITRLVGTILLEANDERAVQRGRYISLETIAQVSNDPLLSMPGARSIPMSGFVPLRGRNLCCWLHMKLAAVVLCERQFDEICLYSKGGHNSHAKSKILPTEEDTAIFLGGSPFNWNIRLFTRCPTVAPSKCGRRRPWIYDTVEYRPHARLRFILGSDPTFQRISVRNANNSCGPLAGWAV